MPSFENVLMGTSMFLKYDLSYQLKEVEDAPSPKQETTSSISRDDEGNYR
jgi:hypothetical protein